MFNIIKTALKVYEKPGLLVAASTGIANVYNAVPQVVKNVQNEEKADKAFEAILACTAIVGVSSITKSLIYGVFWPGTLFIYGWRMNRSLQFDDANWTYPMTNLGWYDDGISKESSYLLKQQREKYRLPWENPFYKKQTKDVNTI
jgi:hypothetical protein